MASFSPVVCEQTATRELPRTPRPGARRTAADGSVLATGWSYHVADGFGVAVPDGWTYQVVGTTVCFRDPDGVRVLSVDPRRPVDVDPVQACRAEATRLTRAAVLSGYREVRIGRVGYFAGAADWEYRYAGAAGADLHAATRWFAAGRRAYALGWVTREFDWPANRSLLSTVLASFAPIA